MAPKNIVWLALAVVSFLSGMADQYFYPGIPYPPTIIVATIACLLLLFAWYRIDAEQRGYRRSRLLDIGVILLAIVALPYYFFRSRGAKGGLLATGALIAAWIGSSMLVFAGSVATYYGLQA
ncbi:hypothetical protein LVB87_11340 [Lysobacter sp. KIS68-7]|uniref:hypothetical protein n=1 Tax=Lysobacter sp. KIS68-7 TaxID=2904252 RepID=UPI001E57D4FE|nr:hypothetical protein [Lysobacter sp. KIS68-7]UHQ18775.1 hypothetical protein LVB87_11340 [Lysobacter sp. KIS68-7]